MTQDNNKHEVYNYREAVKEAVLAEIKENYTGLIFDWQYNEIEREEVEQKLYDELIDSDSVTGNASGSYFCNSWAAEDCLAHNWDLLREAAEAFGIKNILPYGPESCDVFVRCHVLSGAISDALDVIDSGAEW